MAGIIGDSEVESVLERIRRGQLEVDSTHPNAEAYQMALATYNMDKMATGMSSPHTADFMKSAIDMALAQGVIKPSNAYLERLAKAIKDKKITEQDIDSAEGDSGAKNYLKGLWSKLVDKSQNEIVETLISTIKTQPASFLLLLTGLGGG